MHASLLIALDWFGIAVFAATGALVASRKEMDVFGFALLAIVTGVGGGTVRDLLLGRLPVFWVQEPAYILVCVIVAVILFFTAHLPESRYRLLLWFDAIGLSLFAVVGADRALEVVPNPVIAIVMGVITATFGGIIRDILGGEVPVLLRKEIYVTAALAGAAVFVGGQALGLVAQSNALLAGFLACLLVRGLALWFGWSLPPYRARPGRPQDGGRR
ncbi:MAG: trimeric intracellular cation channel family protein [Hyphomicrobium sp.]|nr:trimeric intracellular cation channel family protein [Hyphomicrobium sp.]OJU27339.1 MAG: hypothetical protein BGN89_16480 [Alphaproteobacteria bacterium 64-6]